MTHLNRRKMLAAVSAVPAAAALGVPALASEGEDAELRRLWGEYLEQLAVYKAGREKVNGVRATFDAEAPKGVAAKSFLTLRRNPQRLLERSDQRITASASARCLEAR